MRLIRTYRAYRALTPEQRRVLKDKQVEGERTPKEWLELLSPPAAYDGLADEARGQAQVAMIVAPVLTFVAALFGTALLGTGGPNMSATLALTLAVTAPFVAIFLVTRSTDLADPMRRVALPLLALLGDDVATERTVRLAMDLHGATAKTKLREERPAYKRGSRNVRERVYDDPWMTGSATLVDRSRVHWRLADEVRELRISRRNARGKTKTKTKFKVRSLIELTLELPASAYRRRAAAAGANLQLGARDGDKWIRLRGRRITVQKGTKPQAAPFGQVLRTLTDLYAQVEPVAQGGA